MTLPHHALARRSIVSLVTAGALAASLTGGAGASAAVGPAPGDSFPDPAGAQIAALQKVKGSLSKAERKLSSDLSIALRSASDPSIAAALPGLRSALAKSTAGTVTVDITATVTPALMSRLATVGATVAYASATAGSVRASVPVASLTTVAAWADVRSVRSAATAMTANAKPTPAPTKQERVRRVEANLRAALAPSAEVGAVTSEGDATHAADAARATRHVTGVGVKVCVLSDGVDSLAASRAAGELPAVDVLPGQAGAGDEGTAMLEIIHDLAPGSALGFATAFTSDASFADNIRALRRQGRCQIIVDDVIYFNEATFQDGPIAQAVIDVTNAGALYFSSAGNEGSVRSGTSANYEGRFVNSGQGIGKFIGTAHDFDPGPRVQVYEPVSFDGFPAAPAILQWANPRGRGRRLRPVPLRRHGNPGGRLPGRPGRDSGPVRDPRRLR
ncbi:MAG TPA: hypothetical protein VHM65_02445 [Candidatus Lustribacter sp.]|nr:hypothetical protein [Candidatus Lustribacter sp.]